MKLVYFTLDDLTVDFAWSVHIKEVVQRLCKRGWEVILSYPDYQKGKPLWWQGKSIILPMWRGKISKIFSYFFLSFFHLFFHLLKSRPQILYCRGIHLMPAPLLCSFILKIPLVMEINGLSEMEIGSRFVKFLIRISHFIYLAKAKAIVTVSDLLKEGLINLYKAKDKKIFVIHNGADISRFTPEISQQQAREKIGLAETDKVFVYTGSFYKHHYLELIIYAAKYLEEKAKFLLVGDGDVYQRIKALAREIESKNVVFCGKVPHPEIPYYLAASDVCLYTLYNTYSRYFGFSPIKVYEYMASGRAIAACSNMQDIIDFVNKNKIGVAMKITGNPRREAREFAQMLMQLADSTEKENYARNARKLAEEVYNWDVSVDRLHALLKTLI